MGAKHFLPRFSKYLEDGTLSGFMPDIGSNTLVLRASSATPVGQRVAARWGDIYANSTNLKGNLLIGQGSLSTDSTSTSSQITFGDDFYIAQMTATVLKIGTGVDSSSGTIILSYDVPTNNLVTEGNYIGAGSITCTQFKPSTANFIFYEGTANDHETTMTITDPTADRTITFPDASGTVAFTSGVGVTSLSGTTANGITTYASTGTLDVEQYLTFTNSSNISTLELLSDQDTGDKFSIATTTHGATTITTVDDDATAANLTFTIDGNITLSTPDEHYSTSIDRRKFTITSSTDHDHNGDVVYFGGGSTTKGDICYLKTDGEWASAQANAENTSTQLLAIALGTDPDTDGMLLRGMITLDHDVGNNQGVTLYLSDGTAGQATVTAPDSNNDVVRVIGYNMGDDDQIWFCPDNTWVVVSA